MNNFRRLKIHNANNEISILTRRLHSLLIEETTFLEGLPADQLRTPEAQESEKAIEQLFMGIAKIEEGSGYLSTLSGGANNE
jgi:hypothetical protein